MISSGGHIRNPMRSIMARGKTRLILSVGSTLPNTSYLLDLMYHLTLNTIYQMSLRNLVGPAALRTRSHA
jgi:hypothetical protein